MNVIYVLKIQLDDLVVLFEYFTRVAEANPKPSSIAFYLEQALRYSSAKIYNIMVKIKVLKYVKNMKI